MAVSVYTDKCNGISKCPGKGLCIEVCALNAIENIDDRPVIHEESCFDCGLCVTNCPNEALSNNA